MADSKPDPKVNAELLLSQVLPTDLYLQLCAHEYFDITVGERTYRLSKKKKTEITQKNGQVDSACIHPSDQNCPTADRVVAEYLLLKNDEAEYLKTANLTMIRPPKDAQVSKSVAASWDGRVQRDYFPYAYVEYDPRGGVPQFLTPQRRGQEYITIGMIAQSALYLLREHERMRGLRWPLIPYRDGSTIGMTVIYSEMQINQVDLTLSMDDFVRRFLPPAIERLVSHILNPRHIVQAIVELPVDHLDDAQTTDRDGFSLCVRRRYDIATNSMRSSLEVGIIAIPR